MNPTPRRWWTCPLDVEHLAWTAVTEAADAARLLADVRGLDLTLTTDPALVAASFAAIEHLRVDGRAPQAWAPLSGFFRAADGWVRLHGNYPHHAAAIERALGASTKDEVAAAVATMPALAVEDAVTAQGGIGVAVRTCDEWVATPHGTVTADEPWCTVEPLDGRALPEGHRDHQGSRPLAGVRVLDLTRVIAGPTCSQLLACLGADVLRIDPPDRPELTDQHLSTGMGKRSAVADLADLDLEPLLTDADVVLLGYRPGSLDRFGLDPRDLAERHPHLVIGSLTAWGEDGPWAQRPGFDSIVQAASGIAVACGSPEQPGALPVQALDHATGYLLAAQVMKLLARRRTGIVHISLLGAARRLLGLPTPPPGAPEPEPMPVPTVTLGDLTVVPPPVLVDGRTIEQPVGEYGAAEPRWVALPEG